jgi:predicted DNA-binding protein (UPF0251 family)
MARPPKEKNIQARPDVVYFRPRGVYLADLEEITLSLAELESLRLVHVEGLQQVQAAKQLGVHQSTLQRVLSKAEQKTAIAVVKGCALRIGNA